MKLSGIRFVALAVAMTIGTPVVNAQKAPSASPKASDLPPIYVLPNRPAVATPVPMEIGTDVKVAYRDGARPKIFILSALLFASDYKDFADSNLIHVTIPFSVKDWAKQTITARMKLLSDKLRPYQDFFGKGRRYDMLSIMADGATLEVLAISPSTDGIAKIKSIGASVTPAGLDDWNLFSSSTPEEFMKMNVLYGYEKWVEAKKSGIISGLPVDEYSLASIGFMSQKPKDLLSFLEELREKKIAGQVNISGNSASLQIRWNAIESAQDDIVNLSKQLCALAKERAVRCISWDYAPRFHGKL